VVGDVYYQSSRVSYHAFFQVVGDGQLPGLVPEPLFGHYPVKPTKRPGARHIPGVESAQAGEGGVAHKLSPYALGVRLAVVQRRDEEGGQERVEVVGGKAPGTRRVFLALGDLFLGYEEELGRAGGWTAPAPLDLAVGLLGLPLEVTEARLFVSLPHRLEDLPGEALGHGPRVHGYVGRRKHGIIQRHLVCSQSRPPFACGFYELERARIGFSPVDSQAREASPCGNGLKPGYFKVGCPDDGKQGGTAGGAPHGRFVKLSVG
jgi:hypothetical protein